MNRYAEGISKPLNHRVLVIRWSSMGDLVMALPTAATVYASEPSARLAWFTEDRYKELLEHHKRVEKVYTFARLRYKGQRWKPWTWKEQLRGYLQLREFKPDIAIDLHGYFKTALALLFSGAKERYVVDPKEVFIERFGTVIRTPRHLHTVEAFLLAVERVGFSNRCYEFGIPIRAEHEVWVNEAVGEGNWITLHLGTSRQRKIWDISKYAEITRRLQQMGLKVVLVGGAGERPLAETFLEQAQADDLVGRTSLLQTAEIIRRARFHISGDTGTAHIAAALGIPCVTIFGPTPPHRYHPFGQPEAVVASDGDIFQVDVETVWRKCLERLALARKVGER